MSDTRTRPKPQTLPLERQTKVEVGTTGNVIDPKGVDHPAHYNVHPSGVECIQIVEHMPFNIGTAVKHVWRYGLKDVEYDEQDLDKAIWYLQREKFRRNQLKAN